MVVVVDCLVGILVLLNLTGASALAAMLWVLCASNGPWASLAGPFLFQLSGPTSVTGKDEGITLREGKPNQRPWSEIKMGCK